MTDAFHESLALHEWLEDEREKDEQLDEQRRFELEEGFDENDL